MSSIPVDVLTRISSLQGYERQLEVASVAQQYGMAPEEVEAIANRFSKGGGKGSSTTPFASTNYSSRSDEIPI